MTSRSDKRKTYFKIKVFPQKKTHKKPQQQQTTKTPKQTNKHTSTIALPHPPPPKPEKNKFVKFLAKVGGGQIREECLV